MGLEHKIIFAGPVGSGKTTAISSISDIPVVSTERAATDEVAMRKANTTVAMDYGVLNLDGGARVHLYGAPGQERFDFMWEILTYKGMGLVIMLDQTRKELDHDLDYFLKAFRNFIDKVNGAVVIGITRCDLTPGVCLQPLRDKVLSHGLNIPLFEVDARKRQDVQQLLLALLSNLHPVVSRAKPH